MHVCNVQEYEKFRVHPLNRPRMNSSLYASIDRVFESKSDLPCLHTASTSWTFGQIRSLTHRSAGALIQLGIQRGDRVLAQGGKCPQSLALYLACLQLGVIYVPLNTSYTRREIDYFIGDTEPALFVSNRVRSSSNSYPFPVFAVDDRGIGTFADLVAQSNSYEDIEELETGDLAAILYTSGTTGRSKGAMLSHGNLVSNANALIEYWDWRPNDVLLHALPIYHVHGLFVATHCALLTGTQIVWHEKFDVKRTLADLPRCTVMMGVPTYYSRLLGEAPFDSEVVSNMRLFISGSAPLSEQTFMQFVDRTGMQILERYGMSETLMNTSNPVVGNRVPGTVGFPLPGVEVQVVDEDGKIYPSSEVGNIEVRGPNVFDGYWRMPEKRETEFRSNGYFKTGDMGFLNEEGRLTIVGRDKDVVISGGLNIYPAEIESAIDEYDGIVETAVIGAPHPDFGEGLIAVVVTTSPVDLTDLREFLTDRLASFKHPKALRQVEQLPRNAMGKIQKNSLREKFADTFQSTDGASSAD